jgi:uncharacterized protein YegL
MYKGALLFLALAVCSVYADHPACFSGKLDLVLVIDVSGSVENRFLANRDGALDISKSLPISWDKCSIAIIQYSKMAIMKLEFGSSTNWELVNDTLSNLEWTGDVSLTAEAMDLAMIMFRRSRPDAQRAIVLFSDGNSFNSWQEVVATSERLKYSEAKIFAVSLGGNTYETELKQYCQHSNGTIVRRQSEFQDLKRELQSMTVPRCPPPAASPPPDFQRPSNGDSENVLPENALPTRRPENQLPTRRLTTRRLPTPPRPTAAAVATAPTAGATRPTVAPIADPAAGAAPVPLGVPGSAPIAPAAVSDINLDKRRRVLPH